MAQVTEPVILDSTGQQIVTALNNLGDKVKPTADQIKRTSSNNQTVEAELVSLNSKLIEYTTMSNGTELNSLTAKANYMVGNIAQMGHAPTGCGSSGFFYVDIKSNYVLQRFFGNLGSAHRFSYDGGSTWTNWVDPFNQAHKRTNWGTTVVVEHDSINLMWLVALNASEVYIVANQSGGIIVNQIFGTTTQLTITRDSANQFTITKATNGSIYAMAI